MRSLPGSLALSRDDKHGAFTGKARVNAVLPASEYRLARFYLMRQLLHHFYTAVFLLIGSSGKPIERKVEVPAFREFHDDMWADRVDLAGNEMKLQYGFVHMNEALQNTRGALLQDALQIVAAGYAAA